MKAAISMLLIFVVWLLVGSAQANPYDDGVDAFMRKDYRKAYVLWLPLAKTGDPDAARNVGRLFHEGLGVERDYREAALWYDVAARKCNATAQNNLGLLYLNGQGVPKDPVTAFRLFEKSANQALPEDADAMANLGSMKSAGVGTQQNVIDAYKWYALFVSYTTNEQSKRRAKEYLTTIENKMSQPQKQEAQRRIAAFRKIRCVPEG